ncbi:MAG: hypothetical protein WCC87_04395 [Candidatus Korobacteraceae bacterium]
MKAFLMHRDRDFDLQQPLPWNAASLAQDLGLETVMQAMSVDDEFLFDISRRTILCGMANDTDTILYRQAVLKDCLSNSNVVREIYNLIVATLETARRQWWGLASEYPSSVLYSSNDVLTEFVGVFRKLRTTAEEHGQRFQSEGFASLFSMFTAELNENYLAQVLRDLAALRFRKGVLFSAQLGDSHESTNLVLRRPHSKKQTWLERIRGKGPPGYMFHLDPHDETGGRLLSEMRSRGIARVAFAMGQSVDHIVNFFKMLRTELAFYVGCLNLHDALTAKGLPVAFPSPRSAGERSLNFSSLYDVCLALHMETAIVGNTINADGKHLLIITGANQGGKSTFLRSIGLAQMMMQCGLFVGADSFNAALCPALFTHFRREEDANMKSGKLDEELARMSEIADHLVPNSMLLFNESFAATNEREGSEIAKQIVCALLEGQTKILYVTHLHEFARGCFERRTKDALFLRAERKEHGTRTFKLLEGEPLETSFGEDLYRTVFVQERETTRIS